MIIGLLGLLLVCLNLGGIATIVLQVGRAETMNALGSLAIVAVLNVVGFWLIRQLRNVD